MNSEMSDMDIVQSLIAHDNYVTHEFFHKKCHNLFVSIIHRIFPYEVDEQEFVNELYIYLMENDGARLKQFEGRSTLLQWLKVVAIRYFIKKKGGIIEDKSREPEMPQEDNGSSDDEEKMSAEMTLEHLFTLMQNERYVYVIRRSVLEDAEPELLAAELGVTVENLYNIKKRAIAALTKVALKEKNIYGTRY